VRFATGRLGEVSRGQAFVMQEVSDRAGDGAAVVVTVVHSEKEQRKRGSTHAV
jgi:hypothetical protein